MTSQTPTTHTARPDHRRLDLAGAVSLVVAIAGTIVGWMQQWPAQFGGAGVPGQVGSELFGKGTVLSPPLFMVIAMLVGMGLARLRWSISRRVGHCVAGVIGAISVVGSLGEVVAHATPDVPRPVQWVGLLGVALSLAVVAAVVLDLSRSRAGWSGAPMRMHATTQSQ